MMFFSEFECQETVNYDLLLLRTLTLLCIHVLVQYKHIIYIYKNCFFQVTNSNSGLNSLRSCYISFYTYVV